MGVEALNSGVKGIITGSRFSSGASHLQAVACGDQEQREQVMQAARDGASADLLARASAAGWVGLMKELVEEAGADVNVAPPKMIASCTRCLPLGWSAMGGHKAAIELLLSKGADING